MASVTAIEYQRGKVTVFLSDGRKSPKFDTEAEANKWIAENKDK